MSNFVKARKRRDLLREAGEGGEKKNQCCIGNCRTGIEAGASKTFLCIFRTFCGDFSPVCLMLLQYAAPFKKMYITHIETGQASLHRNVSFRKIVTRSLVCKHETGIDLG